MIKVRKVETKKDMTLFVKLPSKIYQGNDCYIPDLEYDVRDTFNPKKNPGYECADVQPFIAVDDSGECVGRIAGIINRRANETWKTQTVRFGFIEFVDDIEVSRALLNAVEQWGREHQMTVCSGPLGITDFDKEGMLIEDFDMEGSMTAIYNPPYYPQHMEQLGYGKAVDWLQVQIDVPEELPKRFQRVAKMAPELYDLHVAPYTRKEISRSIGKKVFHMFNRAYAPLFGFSSFSDKQIQQIVDLYLSVVDAGLITVVENSANEVVGCGISMSSMNDALRKSGGRIFPFGWFYLLKTLKWKPEKTANMILIGVDPEYQGKGVNAIIFAEQLRQFHKRGFTRAETGPQLEENIKEMSQWKLLSPTFCKRRRCFTKNL